jgi:hypothetical protein
MAGSTAPGSARTDANNESGACDQSCNSKPRQKLFQFLRFHGSPPFSKLYCLLTVIDTSIILSAALCPVKDYCRGLSCCRHRLNQYAGRPGEAI